ncbi:MAG: hypothetical protein N2053_06085 [Chitinispirillaceae bacterium]|nr:hypothetical protein [Chitinispirillaceae bacterium]
MFQRKKNSMGVNRTHFFIDHSFQGRYMLWMAVPMVILVAFMLVTLYMAIQTLQTTTVKIIKNDIESKISFELQDQVAPSAEKYKGLIDDILNYFRNFSSNKEFKKSLTIALLWVFGSGIVLITVQLILLTIFFSHKIAGPVYRLEKTCHNMIQGNYTNDIRLRKGDEMQNLARLLNEVNRVTRDRFLELKNAKTKEEVEAIFKKLEV